MLAPPAAVGKRRKRRKLVLKPKKRLPKIFTCPHCGAQLVSVKRVGRNYAVVCGGCGLRHEFEPRPGWMPVDYYNALVDLYLEGRVQAARGAPEGSGHETGG